MKNNLILIIFTIFIGVSCKKESSTTETVPSPLLKTKWVLSHIQDNKTNAIVNYPNDASHKISIVFTDSMSTVHFEGVCNDGIGKYNYSSSGVIQVSDLVTTLVACKYVEWERYTITNLFDAYEYSINGNSLEIQTNGTYILHFQGQN